MINEVDARKFLLRNTTYPTYWINELKGKKLIAIYLCERKKKDAKDKIEYAKPTRRR